MAGLTLWGNKGSLLMGSPVPVPDTGGMRCQGSLLKERLL